MNSKWNRKIRIRICLLCQAGLILLFFLPCLQSYSPQSVMDDMVSRDLERQCDGVWYIDEESGVSEGKIFLFGPYSTLEPGGYTVAVEYETDWNQSMDIYSKHNSAFLFADESVSLGKSKTIVTTKIRAAREINDFEIRLYYAGKGFVKIDNITIVRNNEQQKENVILCILVILIIDLCFYFGVVRKSIKFMKMYPVLCGIASGIALSVDGKAEEGASFIGILANECNGIGMDKMMLTLVIIHVYQRRWYLVREIKSRAVRSVAVFFSVFMLIGISFSCNGNLSFITGSFSRFIISIIVFQGYYYIFRMAAAFLFTLKRCNNEKENICYSGKFISIMEKHTYSLAVLTIVAGWLPYLIIFFPGSVSWDGLQQINEGMGYSRTMTNHHPWLVTTFMALLMKTGQTVSDNTGVFVIVLVFVVMEVLCYGFVCCRVRKYTNDDRAFMVSVLFFAIVPAFGAFANVIIKDGINAALFAWFMALYADCYIKADRKQLLQVKDLILLGVSALLVCVTRKNGIYLVLPQCVLLVIRVSDIKQMVGVIFLSVSVLAGQYITDVRLPDYLGVIKGSEREMLSIPFQQTARYLLYFPEDVTQEEKNAIEAVLPADKIAQVYYPEKSDAVKNKFKSGAGFKELKEYFRAWFSMMKKHPLVYAESVLEGSYGYFFPFRNCEASERYFLYIKGEPVTTGDMYIHYLFSREIRGMMESWADLWVKLPVLAQIMNPGAYTWLLILLTAYMIYRKKPKGILLYVAPFLNVLVCIASPVNGLVRYTLPLMACMPLLTGWCCFCCRQTD